jgi:hypothetical protein
MKGVTGREAMEPSEYNAVNIPSCEPFGSPKYFVKGSRIRRLFNIELSTCKQIALLGDMAKNIPIISSGRRSDTNNERIKVELPESRVGSPVHLCEVRSLSLRNLDLCLLHDRNCLNHDDELA